jgi:glutathione synthase/RimK-type ligase-like ATP-grasp enzyme
MIHSLYHVLMKKCAFLTLDDRGDFVIDDEFAIGPLADIGWRVSTVPWRQKDRPWSDFDAVIIRSTWDYWNNVPAFLDVLAQINRETRLANPLDLVHWNLAKTYMRDLEGKGIGIVPTMWPDVLQAASMAQFFDQLDTPELVVKPVVGANGEDAFRVSIPDSPARLKWLATCFHGRECMVQRFMPAILTEGEYSLFFFAGEFSHAILKVPAKSEFRSQEEHGAEIRAVEPAELVLKRAYEALKTLEPAPLYARIDLVRDDANDFAVMELELIEPSMYLRMDPAAPHRFARAVDQWF